MNTKNQVVTDHPEFRCEHCRKSFVRLGSLAKHSCEPKRRWEDRSKPASRIAFSCWLKFYQQYQPRGKQKEYPDFMSSPYYGGFVKYGDYCIDRSVINASNYADWLLKSRIPLDKWTTDTNYGRYLIEYIRIEDTMDAIKRSVETLLSISESENVHLGDVLRYTNSNKICHHIISGKISPWLLFNSESGVEFLSTLNSGQTDLVFEYINPDHWNNIFKFDPDRVREARNVLKMAGI